MFKVTTWPSRMHAATHILQEKTHACGVLKRHNFRVYVSLGSAETLVRRGGIINHSIAYSLSNISAQNYRNRLMWVESIVCNISVVFFGTQCIQTTTQYGHVMNSKFTRMRESEITSTSRTITGHIWHWYRLRRVYNYVWCHHGPITVVVFEIGHSNSHSHK